MQPIAVRSGQRPSPVVLVADEGQKVLAGGGAEAGVEASSASEGRQARLRRPDRQKAPARCALHLLRGCSVDGGLGVGETAVERLDELGAPDRPLGRHADLGPQIVKPLAELSVAARVDAIESLVQTLEQLGRGHVQSLAEARPRGSVQGRDSRMQQLAAAVTAGHEASGPGQGGGPVDR